MYDCSGPMLVFVTQTHHPLLGHHTGYIFAEYDVMYSEPRELFFEHIATAQAYALKCTERRNRVVRTLLRGTKMVETHPVPPMQLVLDPDLKPERLCAQSFLTSLFDYGDFPDAPEIDGGQPSSEPEPVRKATAARKAAEYRKRKLRALADVNFFGEDL
jgi:hypothetical protein